MIKKILSKILAVKNKKNELPFDGYDPANGNFYVLNGMSDEELSRLNNLLPWSSWIVDSKGRRFGNRFSTSKRIEQEVIPDRRILELNNRFDLSTKHVLEIGCFEGNHTIALSQLSAEVTAIDSRIENVVKTTVRCMLASEFPKVHLWDTETEVPPWINAHCDILHHVGVLYHLRDPVTHLRKMAELTSEALMLDTHVAPSNVELIDCFSYKCWEFKEHGRSNPFAGMYDFARWLVLEDLLRLLKDIGFTNVEVFEKRQERNGPRVLIYANK